MLCPGRTNNHYLTLVEIWVTRASWFIGLFIESSTPCTIEKNRSTRGLIRPMLSFLLRRPNSGAIIISVSVKSLMNCTSVLQKVYKKITHSFKSMLLRFLSNLIIELYQYAKAISSISSSSISNTKQSSEIKNGTILGNCPTWRTNSFQYIYL